MTDEPTATPTSGRRCPICGKLATLDQHPFCSKRCADIDLNRWLGGVYAVPASEDCSPDDSDESDAC